MAAPAAAATINVPSGQPTIGLAIATASNGDTILVAPGHYSEIVDFSGKSIELRSTGGPDVTTIQGAVNTNVINIVGGSNQVVEGFTIRGGFRGVNILNSSPMVTGNRIVENEGCGGGGVRISGTSTPTISNNYIANNVARDICVDRDGGGIQVAAATAPVITDNIIELNYAGSGAGIYFANAEGMVLRNNLIRRNTSALNGAAYGIGTVNASLIQNVIVDNETAGGGGIELSVPSSGTETTGMLLVNNTISGNSSGRSVFVDSSVTRTHAYNNVLRGVAYCNGSASIDFFSNNVETYGGLCTNQTGLNGNISQDPLFVNAAFSDYRLTSTSPSKNVGSNSAPSLPAADFIGTTRILETIVDQGAYEFDSNNVPVDSFGEFTPLPPTRVLDSRINQGRIGKLGHAQSFALDVTTPESGVPDDALAVVVNVTVTNTALPYTGFITVYPDDGGSPPTAANLNFAPGETRPNLVTVALGSNGNIRIYNGVGSIDVVGDVAGYYSAQDGTEGSRFHGTTPERIADTRFGVNGHTALGPNGTMTVDVVNESTGVPNTGVTAVVMNVTVTQPTASSWFTVYPADEDLPTAANLNFIPGQTVPNLVVVKVSADANPGRVKIYNAYGSSHVIVDVVGWYDDDESTEAGRFVPIDPTRIFDTRFDDFGFPPPNPLGPSEGVIAQFGPGIGAVVTNTAVTGTTAVSWLTAYPANVSTPNAANLNWVPGLTVSNLVIVKAGDSGGCLSCVIYQHGLYGKVHVIVDLNGFFTDETFQPGGFGFLRAGQGTDDAPDSLPQAPTVTRTKG